jgi:hypothetical protein
MMRTFCFAAPKGDRKNMISFHPVAAVSQWGKILSEKACIIFFINLVFGIPLSLVENRK